MKLQRANNDDATWFRELIDEFAPVQFAIAVILSIKMTVMLVEK